jgi:hypothetical protein
MAYGTLAVDYITYTSNSNDQSITISGLVNGNFPNLVTTGTLSGVTITGNTLNVTTGNANVFAAGHTSPVTTFDISGAYSSNINAVSAVNINCGSGNYFTKTVSSGTTFTVSNVPSGRAYSFTLEVTHTSGVITWFSGVVWPNGTTPSLITGKTHLFMFVTDDAGAKWRASSLINYTN